MCSAGGRSRFGTVWPVRRETSAVNSANVIPVSLVSSWFRPTSARPVSAAIPDATSSARGGRDSPGAASAEERAVRNSGRNRDDVVLSVPVVAQNDVRQSRRVTVNADCPRPRRSARMLIARPGGVRRRGVRRKFRGGIPCDRPERKPDASRATADPAASTGAVNYSPIVSRIARRASSASAGFVCA